MITPGQFDVEINTNPDHAEFVRIAERLFRGGCSGALFRRHRHIFLDAVESVSKRTNPGLIWLDWLSSDARRSFRPVEWLPRFPGWRPFRLSSVFVGVLAGVLTTALAGCSPTRTYASENWRPDLLTGAVFRDCGNCPEMVVIPPGRLLMGSAQDEVGRYRQEGPQQIVAIPHAFAISRFEITRGQWARFVAESGHASDTGCFTWQGDRLVFDPRADWRIPGFAQTDSHPAVCLNWDDVQSYALWLSNKTGKSYRLPSEEAWEYAARAGSTSSRPWGEAISEACRYANVSDATGKQTHPSWVEHPCDDGEEYTAPVGRYHANDFGLHDMLGNVWEWTEGCWTEELGSEVRNCAQRVLRGGGWMSKPDFARSATRHRLDVKLRFSEIGFRLLRLP